MGRYTTDMRLYRFALVIVLLFSGLSVHAQGIGSTEPFSLVINPEFPRPYQSVSISPRSTLINLAASTVVIRVNGQEVERGSGQVVGYARMGAPGEATTVSVSITNGGQTHTKELTLRAADVALVVEPLSTAHPFYRGGSLAASEGRVRLVAVPDVRTSPGSPVAPQNLIYTWRLGSQVLQSASGIGKNSIEATAPVRYRDARISVTVTTQDESVVAYAQTLVSPIDPVLRIYRNDPLLGPLFDNALIGSVTMASGEETYRVVPYYFPSTPVLTWDVNSVESGGERDITVRANGNGRGSALLSAHAKGGKLFQVGETALTVRFGEADSFGIFGL